jgi:ferritin-like metal-binding protein YciE
MLSRAGTDGISKRLKPNDHQMEASVHSLEHLFEDTLKDIYYAEKAILKALPKMAKGAHSDELREAFEEHIGQTEEQVKRLEKVFEIMGKKAQGKTCPAIEGLIEEGSELLKEAKNPTVLDAGLLAAAQAVEHYEIARYGTLCAWAEKLAWDEAAELLGQTLEEEKETDEKLSMLAQSEINVEASESGDGGEDDEGASKSRRSKSGSSKKTKSMSQT